MAVMAPKDRHKKKPFQLRLPAPIRAQLELLTEINASHMTQEITIAIRERLERFHLWPPPRAEGKDGR